MTMKMFMTCAALGLVAFSAQAGEKPVIYYTMTDVPGTYDTTSLNPVQELTTIRGLEGTTSPAAPARVVVGQKGVIASGEDAVYAALLKEAKKRGLR